MRTAKVQQQVLEEENNQYDFLKYKNKTLGTLNLYVFERLLY